MKVIFHLLKRITIEIRKKFLRRSNVLLSVGVFSQLRAVALSVRSHHWMYSPPETTDQLPRDFVVFSLVYYFLRVNFSNDVELLVVAVVVVKMNKQHSTMTIVRIWTVVCELLNVQEVRWVLSARTTIVLIYQSKNPPREKFRLTNREKDGNGPDWFSYVMF